MTTVKANESVHFFTYRPFSRKNEVEVTLGGQVIDTPVSKLWNGLDITILGKYLTEENLPATLEVKHNGKVIRSEELSLPSAPSSGGGGTGSSLNLVPTLVSKPGSDETANDYPRIYLTNNADSSFTLLPTSETDTGINMLTATTGDNYTFNGESGIYQVRTQVATMAPNDGFTNVSIRVGAPAFDPYYVYNNVENSGTDAIDKPFNEIMVLNNGDEINISPSATHSGARTPMSLFLSARFVPLALA